MQHTVNHPFFLLVRRRPCGVLLFSLFFKTVPFTFLNFSNNEKVSFYLNQFQFFDGTMP